MGVEDHAPSAAEVAEAAVSEALIAVHWREEEYYPPPPLFVAQLGPKEPEKYSYHFKTMTTVGEPIEPDAWRWYHSFVKGEAAITDTWWRPRTAGFSARRCPGCSR
jgi:hypothetical protein